MQSFFLTDNLPQSWSQEWIDAFWAKDIQELFRLERRHSFQKFFELLLHQSGGMLKPVGWSVSNFDPSGMQAFRRQYEKAENYVVVNDMDRPVRRSFGSISAIMTTLPDRIKALRANRC
jgi:hypothetical protein